MSLRVAFDSDSESENDNVLGLRTVLGSTTKNEEEADHPNSKEEDDEVDKEDIDVEKLVEDTTIVSLNDDHNKTIQPNITKETVKVTASQTQNHNQSNDENREWAHVVDVNQDFTDFHTLVPEMAIQYPFELDTFQKRAIYHLEQGNSVFVAAHTSAGKTVVAEYAIAMAQQHKTRCIYTSPIKALSNQKFRDFKDTFEDVGIVTGDVQINQEARCLIMTTEILRSMLYRRSELIPEIEFVIFDEVHYANDPDRGVVWEEVLIMLPPTVTLIMLSATVPNTKEFADWVGRNKKKDIYVIATPYRPVPLEHYLFFDKKAFKIMSQESIIQQDGYREAIQTFKDKTTPSKPAAAGSSRGGGNSSGGTRGRGSNVRGNRGRGGSSGGNNRGGYVSTGGSTSGANKFQGLSDRNLYMSFVAHLSKMQLLPVIIFSFSKKKCEAYADSLSNQDYTVAAEKSRIHVFIEQSLQKLNEVDRDLPQIIRMKEMLTRGIGVHHGGLLPIVKEIVEILFTQGVIKLLFTTETFAMGVNAPARCVAFTSLQKHDGTSLRDLLPGEYTQMSGRAGRRGLDKTGSVMIICNDKIPDLATLTKMLTGSPTTLKSQFRLTYNMILSIALTEGMKVEDMIKRSFSENAGQKLIPQLLQAKVKMEKRLKKIAQFDCQQCIDMPIYYSDTKEFLKQSKICMEHILDSTLLRKAICPGRIVVLNNETKFRNVFAMVIGNIDASGSSQFGATPTREMLLANNSIMGSQQQQSVTNTNEERVVSMMILCDSSRKEYYATDIQNITSALEASQNYTEGYDDKTLDMLRDEFDQILPPITKFSVPSPGEADYVVLKLPISLISTITDTVHQELDTRGITMRRTAALDNALLNLESCAREIVTNLPSKQDLKNINATDEFTAIKEMNLSKEKGYFFQSAFEARINSIKSIWSCVCTSCPDFDRHYEQFYFKEMLRDRLENINIKVSGLDLALLPEYSKRMDVLKRLGFLDPETDTLTQLGQVGVGIRTADELILTTIITENLFQNHNPAEIAALLSCLVFEEKATREPVITTNLKMGLTSMVKVVERICQCQKDCGLDYINKNLDVSINTGLVEVVYEWANGMPFKDIMELTDCLEGTIVRTIVRIGETLKEVIGAAKIVGDTVLHTKIEDAQKAIQRDIVFATSLYL